MTAMIDTLKFARSFEQAGFATAQAEALTAAMAEMNRDWREDLVTKTDLRIALAELKSEFKSDLKTEIASVRTEIAGVRTEIATTVGAAKWQILWMMFGSQLFVIAAVVALNNFAKFFS